MAKFYNQRVSGQGSVNNASIYQAALWGKSSKRAHLVAPSQQACTTHTGAPGRRRQPLAAAARRSPLGRKQQEAPKGWHFSEISPPFASLSRGGTGGKAGKGNGQARGAPLPPPRARRPQSSNFTPEPLATCPSQR